jgi:hypothetical protein
LLRELGTLHNLDLVVTLMQISPIGVVVKVMASFLRAGRILGRDEAMRELLEGSGKSTVQ